MSDEQEAHHAPRDRPEVQPPRVTQVVVDLYVRRLPRLVRQERRAALEERARNGATSRKSSDGSDIPDDSIIGWLTRTQRECKHGPPRSTKGRPWGIEDTCTCGATTYMLSPLRGWRYLKGKRP